MSSESDQVQQLDDPRRVDRLLAALESHEHDVSAPAARLILEVDGKTVATIEHGSADVSLRLPPRGRSLTLRDENDVVRGFVLLAEPELEPCDLDGGRIGLTFRREEDGSVRVAVSAGDEAPSAAELPTPAEEPARSRQARVVEAEPAGTMAVARLARGERPGWSRYLAAASVMLLLGFGMTGYFWYQSHQETQARIAAQQAEQERQKQQLERLQQAKQESDRKLANLIDQLKSANSEAERARIQAELEAEQAKAAETGRRIRGVSKAPSGSAAVPACKPGDPLCSDM